MIKKIINFVCPQCGMILRRSFWGRMFAPHRERTMWRSPHTQLFLKCPECKKRYWMRQEEILRKEGKVS